ncbi:MAG TPA: hypothetical protein VGO57_15625 [Verrucomicrobiae bacterium]
MKLNKTLTLAALIAGSLFTGSLVAQAQDATNQPPATVKPGGKARGMNVDFLAKQLSLTDAEKPKVKALLDDQMEKQRDLRKDTSLSKEDKKAKLKEIREATNTKMKDILTPDQFTKWQKFSGGAHRPMPGAASTNAPASK